MKILLFVGLLLMASPALFAQKSPQPPGNTSPDVQTQESPSELLAAEDKIAQKEFDAARPMLDAYIAKHPADARALFDLGFLEDSSDHDQQAATAYRKAIAADPKQFEAQLALGLLLARNGQQDEARPFLEAATQLEPVPANPAAKARAWRALAQINRNSDPTKAKYALLEALKISPETSDDTLLTAEIAEASDDPETAETAYRRVLAAHPDSSVAMAGLVHLLLKQKKYDEAEPLLKSALQRDPDDPALNSQWAATLLAEEKPKEAIAVLEKLHRLHPDDTTVGRMLAETLSETGDYTQADALYAQLLASSPEDADLLMARGECLLHLQKYSEAMAAYRRATKIKPDYGDAWAGMAFASSELKQYTVTLDSLSMRSKYLAETPASYFLWATTYDNLHQLKSAAEYYEKFLAAAQGKFPDQEWQAKHRLVALGKH
jgi:tetratricopeptide (TPR) repeat protein